MRGRSFISKLKRKIRNIISFTNYKITENYDILVFVITQIYATLTKDLIGASILRHGPRHCSPTLQDIADIITQIFDEVEESKDKEDKDKECE